MMMNAVVYFSLSDFKRSEKIARSIEGDCFEIKPLGRVYKSVPAQMFFYGYRTVFNKKVKFESPVVDFTKYDKVYVVSPIWAGKVSQFMRKYLESVPFKNKEVVVIGSCEGGEGKFFKSVRAALDITNDIVEKQLYIKGEKK